MSAGSNDDNRKRKHGHLSSDSASLPSRETTSGSSQTATQQAIKPESEDHTYRSSTASSNYAHGRATYLQVVHDALSENKGGLSTKEVLQWVEAERSHQFPGRSPQAIRSGVQNVLNVQGRMSGPSRKLWMWLREEQDGHKTKTWTLAGNTPTLPGSTSRVAASPGTQHLLVPSPGPVAQSLPPEGHSRRDLGARSHEVPPPPYTTRASPPQSMPLAGATSGLALTTHLPSPSGEQDDKVGLELGRQRRRQAAEAADRLQALQDTLAVETNEKNRVVQALDKIRDDETRLNTITIDLEQQLLKVKQDLRSAEDHKAELIIDLRRRLDLVSRINSDVDIARKHLSSKENDLKEVLTSLGLS